jgi:radical SAM superfamily enzyme YgiQ (UPF0313 family)
MDDFRDRPMPPMGLLSAVALARDRHDVVLVDQRTDRDWKGTLKDLLSSAPLAVGVTAMSGPTVGHALDMVRVVRETGDVPVVWGGTHVTLRAGQIPPGDFLVLGEGEVTFAALLDRLASGRRDAEGIPGVWSREHRNPRAEVLDFGAVPLAAYDLVDFPRYLYSHRGLRTLDYLSSRGCPHRCTYCYNSVFYRGRWSAKGADVVEAEVRYLRARYDFDALYFLDDNFFIDLRRAGDIVRLMPRLSLAYEIQGVDIQTIARMSDEDLDALEASGLSKLTIGVESASDRIRSKIGKWGDSAAALAALRRLANRKFLVLTSFIIGFPTETASEMDRTIEFALGLQELGENFRFPQFYAYTPVPGTALAEELEGAGHAFPSSIEEFARTDWDHYSLAAGDPARTQRLEAIAFLSKFIDRKHRDYGSRRFVSMLYEAYRPVALARLKMKMYSLLLERPLYGALKRLV